MRVFSVVAITGCYALNPTRNNDRVLESAGAHHDEEPISKTSIASLASIYSRLNTSSQKKQHRLLDVGGMNLNGVGTLHRVDSESWRKASESLLSEIPVVFNKIAHNKKSKKGWFTDMFSDCAEFTYHDVQDSDKCYDICETKTDTTVKTNCEWYSSIVDLCSEEDYSYASRSATPVGIPSDLKSQCALGESVNRCKVCDRALTLAEQNAVHDKSGYMWLVWYLSYGGLALLVCVALYFCVMRFRGA